MASAPLVVPYVDLRQQHTSLHQELMTAIADALRHGQAILGPEVAAFEQEFAAYCGARFAVGVGNGTDAIVLALGAVGVGNADEVITAPNSFVASASAIVLAGARPVFVDVTEDFNLDPDRLEEAITPRTRAILPVHLTGRPANMDPILAIAANHGIPVVEDAAQAVGATYKGRRVGSIGVVGCFSLHPLKNLNAYGDGGVITTSNEDTYNRLLKARNHGLRNRDECEFWSLNSRLDTIHAAMLHVKMKHLQRWTEARRQNAAYYRARLAGLVRVPAESPHEYAVYQTFVIEADRRDELQQHLLRRGVETKVHYPIPIHLQQAARSLGPSRRFPIAERLASRILSLPIYPELTMEQKETVVDAVRSFYE